MSRLLPVNLLWTILQPISQGHITMCKVNCVLPPRLGRDRVLLRQNQTHDLTQSYVLQEKQDMHAVRGEFGRAIDLVFNEIIFGHHLYIRIFGIDKYRTSQCNSD